VKAGWYDELKQKPKPSINDPVSGYYAMHVAVQTISSLNTAIQLW
jgi:hypothetical protein